MLMYRQDWFQQLGIQPPATWEQLLALASNSSMWAGLGSGNSSMSGLCLDLAQGCNGDPLLQAIWASLAQWKGTAQGLHFDPLTMTPQANGTAMRAAVNIFLLLAQASGPNSTSSCAPLNAAYINGGCGNLAATALLPTWQPQGTLSPLHCRPVCHDCVMGHGSCPVCPQHPCQWQHGLCAPAW